MARKLPTTKPIGNCINCKRKSYPLRFGQCGRCYEHFRKYGVEWGTKDKPTDPAHTCPRCGEAKDKRAEHCRRCRLVISGDNFKTHKTCNRCKRDFPIESFAWRPTEHGIPKRRSHCKECESNYAKTARVGWSKEQRANYESKKRVHAKANPTMVRRWALRSQWKQLGFDPDIIEELYKDKPDACQICGKECNVVLDHCHRTNKLRGWLCGACNLAIGQLDDNPETLRRAAEYLQRHIEDND